MSTCPERPSTGESPHWSRDRAKMTGLPRISRTVGTLGATWLASQTHLKPSSRDSIEIAWRLFVEPAWGNTAIGEVRHSNVQTWVAQLGSGDSKTAHAVGPRSATVVIRAFGILAAVLDVAQRDRLIAVNPARGVSLPRKGKKEHVYLSHNQVATLSRNRGDKGTLVLTLAYTGLRWGEAVGLRVKDLDTVRHRLSVRSNAVRVGGKIEVGTPKSQESRSVPFPEILTALLTDAAETKPPDQLLFGNGTRVTCAHRPPMTAGSLWESVKHKKSIQPCRASPHTTSDTPQQVWLFLRAPTSKRFNGCSATPRPA